MYYTNRILSEPVAGTLKREVKVIMRKTLYGIRHGEAWHNVLYPTLGEGACLDYQDTSLTKTGMTQAVQKRGIDVGLVFVSPLMRTLQTAELMFPKTPKIALECLKEFPQSRELCNKRSPRTALQDLFPNIDFDNLRTDEDQSFGKQDAYALMERNCLEIRQRVKVRPEQSIALVTHSSWLKIYMGADIGGVEDELEHCKPYELSF